MRRGCSVRQDDLMRHLLFTALLVWMIAGVVVQFEGSLPLAFFPVFEGFVLVLIESLT
jgi:hypothetical protein